MIVEPSLLLETVGLVLAVAGACLGAYVAIRSDLATLHERSTMALNAANRAHERIDQLAGGAGSDGR